MWGKLFQRRKEDFVCMHCGARVHGSGYTNHCPKCLWSRHVDINPGDRAATCGGVMRPVALEGSSPEYVILHRCMKCGFEKRNMVQKEDDVDAVLAVARRTE
jgi:hypothetical protein